MPGTNTNHHTLPVEQTPNSCTAEIHPGSCTVETNTLPEAHPGKEGALGWGLLWLIGIPVPILLLLFVMRGCT